MTGDVVPCIGSADPMVREFLHDIGLCTWNIVALEDDLREHLIRLAVLRAKWPLRVRKLREIRNRYAEVTLGGLVTKYEALGGSAKLVAIARPVADQRRILLHNRMELTDPKTMTVERTRIVQLREALQELVLNARHCVKAVQKANHEVFTAIAERAEREEPPSPEQAALLQMMLNSFGETARGNSETPT